MAAADEGRYHYDHHRHHSSPAEIRSAQTGLRYRVGGLQDSDTEAAVQEALGTAEADIYFSQCRLHERVYAFEVKETVTRTVRIGPPGSRYARPRCEACSSSSSSRGGDTSVCRHVVWVMDHLAAEGGLGGAIHPDAAALTMGPDGHAVEMGSPYELCRAAPMEQLAARLHCRVAPPAGLSEGEVVDAARVAEVRRMLAAVSGPGRWDHYDERTLDLGARRSGDDGPVVQRGDLDGTLFRMLYANPAFFAYFRSQLDGCAGGSGDSSRRRRERRGRSSGRRERRGRSSAREEYREEYGRGAYAQPDGYGSSSHSRRSGQSSRGQYYDYEMRLD
jgi:hypothetical protein